MGYKEEEPHRVTEVGDASHLPGGKLVDLLIGHPGYAPRTSLVCVGAVLSDVCCSSCMDKVVYLAPLCLS